MAQPAAAAPNQSDANHPAHRDHGFHSLRVARIVAETADAISIVLDVPDPLREAFAYEAGQFCTFRVRIDGETQLRCYSMSSAPAVDDELQVTVKRVPDGIVSNWMNESLAEGDEIDVTLPAGVFRLTDDGGDVVALAAGSGITPVISLVKEALATTSRRVHLLYANRDLESTIFRVRARRAGRGPPRPAPRAAPPRRRRRLRRRGGHPRLRRRAAGRRRRVRVRADAVHGHRRGRAAGVGSGSGAVPHRALRTRSRADGARSSPTPPASRP